MKRAIEEDHVCDTEPDTEVDVEDEDVNVVGGVPDAVISGYESEEFILSETIRRRRLAKEPVSEGVVCTSHIPKCQFPNLQ